MTETGRSPVLRFGIFEADCRTGELRRRGVRVRLHGRPFALLAALLERPGQLVTREELRQRLWADDTFVDFDHGLNNAVNRVRQALGDTAQAPRFVETLPRRGYRFIAPVERTTAPLDMAMTTTTAPAGWRARRALMLAVALFALAGASIAVLVHVARSPGTAAGLEMDSPAYQTYLKGRYHQNKPDAASWTRARQFFEEALRVDSRFAPAHAALAAVLNQLGTSGLVPPDEAYALAHATAERAVRLDPALAEAHAALGTAKLRMKWDWPAAERAYQRAIALDSRLPRVHQNYALLLAAMGRWTPALAAIDRARAADPLDVSIHADTGRILYLARRYEEAVRELRSTLELEPRHPQALKLLSDAYLQLGRHREGAESFARWLEAVGVNETERTIAAQLLTEGGPSRLARRNLENPAGKPLDAFGVPLKVAISHAAIGHPHQALDWLERAYRQNDPRLVFLKVDPAFDPLRGEPRFQQLLRTVGL
jgi:DNA-binding winged helix-turn-helix (wHTH) protein/tetratricopeptide (TPR) repeat protein